MIYKSLEWCKKNLKLQRSAEVLGIKYLEVLQIWPQILAMPFTDDQQKSAV